MPAILSHARVWFEVKTIHGDRLEFYLTEMEARQDKPAGHYTDKLIAVVNEALDELQLHVCESQVYGAVMFSVELAPEQLPTVSTVTAAIGQAVDTWARRYNVNRGAAQADATQKEQTV